MTSVSFVAVFYDKEPYVDLVVDAIRGQRGVDDAEYVFVDDGSADGTRERLERHARGLGRAAVVSIPNSGPAAATNRGLARVTKEYVKIVDGDDILHPEATARLIAACRETGAGVAFGDLVRYDAAEARAEGGFRGFQPLAGTLATLHRYPLRRLVKTWQINPTQHLFRAELLARIGGCDERVFIQDYSLALRLARRSAFAEVRGAVAAVPASDAARMTGNEAQILHDVSLATAFFVAENDDLHAGLKRAFLRRAWGRGWKWASRRGGASVLSREFVCYALAQFGLLPPTFENFERACRPFRSAGGVRRPGDVR
jgi:glycosyltransferase involved in cell wall biosynthesis